MEVKFFTSVLDKLLDCLHIIISQLYKNISYKNEVIITDEIYLFVRKHTLLTYVAVQN